jgi:hypothetical protein
LGSDLANLDITNEVKILSERSLSYNRRTWGRPKITVKAYYAKGLQQKIMEDDGKFFLFGL